MGRWSGVCRGGRARLALRSGIRCDALIIVGYAIRESDNFDEAGWSRFEVGCEALIDPRLTTTNDPVGEITQQYTSALERAIRRAPEQYFWIHRRWKSEPRVRQKNDPQRLAG